MYVNPACLLPTSLVSLILCAHCSQGRLLKGSEEELEKKLQKLENRRKCHPLQIQTLLASLFLSLYTEKPQLPEKFRAWENWMLIPPHFH